MDYIPLNKEEATTLSTSILSTQIMMGVYPSEKYVNKIKKKFRNQDLALPNKILEQDKNLLLSSNINFEKTQEINAQMDNTITKLGQNLNLIEETFNSRKVNTNELDLKVGNFENETNKNNEKLNQINDTIPDLQRKKKENEEFFKKYIGEKKVWLDRLKENPIREETYSNGFKYLYEAKIIKLLLEGILLEKVQDMVEKELYTRGDIFGWNIMNIQKMEEQRKEEDFEFNKGLIKLTSIEGIKQEQNQRERLEYKDNKIQKDREDIMKEWKQIFAEIWIPDVVPSVDKDFKTKRDFIINITMEVTFKLFQKIFFDIYKLKNIILSNEDYIIMDKIRNYFPEKIIPGRTQDELVLNQLMNIIESIKAEQDIIYCDLNPAKQKIVEYKNSTDDNTNTTAVENLELIVNKITEIQNIVNESPTALIKAEVEEVRKLINNLPYEKEQKLFLDNFKNSSRFYDTFLPLSNILMVETFISVGKKRDKNYDTKIEEAKSNILELKGKNNEISGKWKLLKEMKENLPEDEVNDIMEKSHEIADNEALKTKTILDNIKKSLNRIIELKNQQQMNSLNFYKKIRKSIIRPKDLC